MTGTTDKPLFQSAKEIHFDKLKVKVKPKSKKTKATPEHESEPEKPKPEPNELKQGPSKYQRAIYEGLCLKCFYEGTDDLNRRPRAPMDAFCPVCLKKMDIFIDSG